MTGPTPVGHLDAVLVPDDHVLDLLRAWVPQQRWFPAKDSEAHLIRLGVARLPDPANEARVQVHLLGLASGTVLQVPIVLGGRIRPGEPGFIGQDGATPVTDGCHEAAFVRAWFAAAEHEPTTTQARPNLTGMHVLATEQSNTSVALPKTHPPAMLKVFRGLANGPSPDVEIPAALSRAGWAGVPRPLAWLSVTWTADGETRTGHLGVLNELVVGAENGFELACRYAAAGLDFGDLAADLGRTTAELHRVLRVTLPVTARLPRAPAARAAAVQAVARTLRDRAEAAIEAAPTLAGRRTGIEAALAVVESLDAVPPLQRVHGDLHLGQVLHAQDRWYVLDFEGEPTASQQERTRPDLALRDLAGMLRSIDYAAAVGGADYTWARAARRRLVEGYHREAEQETRDPATDVLLTVFELDKALYEVTYESGHRPDWVHIPLDGVDRLLAAAR